ncbi:peptide deformylase [Octadecabacter sp. 1_MG-2023]|uniref:peptide deformylase n=1 Tax=unclassified Octadecabacter TaxID=196158 RepID=UPI001C097FA0|nr:MULTISPECIES: peptide deformylase [unclassified Octadecabacter]MBU2992595.1 peptide deformylase [Octadecabacter sp. B2R22]MDO6734648.1 peptide deformylase [Octadecabacter sp. 1_MG-2023]
MSHRPFVPYPAKVLRTPANEVDAVTDDIRMIWAEMIEAMDSMPGVGLAAPQLGIPLQLAVVDASDKRGQSVRMANPKVLHASQELRAHEEASPNVPGASATIKRPRAVTVEFLNEQGEVETKDFVGLWATSVQHQIDHLNGKMYFDRLSRTKRDMLIKKARKLGS